jgi:uncharacterized DUF497 family protein
LPLTCPPDKYFKFNRIPYNNNKFNSAVFLAEAPRRGGNPLYYLIEDGEEVIIIITARKATKKERDQSRHAPDKQ